MEPDLDTNDGSHRMMELLAENRGMTIETISADARLLHDLGMDGDDAVDFFTALKAELGTDLEALEERWNDHFGGEHLSRAGCAAVVVVACAGFALASMIKWGHPLLWMAVFATIWIGAFRGRPLRGPIKIPITVRDVVAAVEAKRWVKSYDKPLPRVRKGLFWGGRS